MLSHRNEIANVSYAVVSASRARYDLDHERVGVPRARLAGQCAVGVADADHRFGLFGTRRINGDSADRVSLRRAELLRPDRSSTGVVLSYKTVGVSRTHLAWKSASNFTADVKVAGLAHHDGVNGIRQTRSKFDCPALVSIAVVLTNERVLRPALEVLARQRSTHSATDVQESVDSGGNTVRGVDQRRSELPRPQLITADVVLPYKCVGRSVDRRLPWQRSKRLADHVHI